MSSERCSQARERRTRFAGLSGGKLVPELLSHGHLRMTGMIERISLPAARRIALAAQGFGAKRPPQPGRAHIRRVLDRIHLYQIDSVNVLTRAHYLPAYSSLGTYDRTDFDRVAWGPKR